MTDAEKALRPLAREVYLFDQHHDREFIRWCNENHHGFVLNATIPDNLIQPGSTLILHGALPNGKLCQVFRNQHELNGCRPHLSTTYRKVISMNLDAILKWARKEHVTEKCTFCERAGCF